MDIEKFNNEIKDYSLDELKLIYETQKDLYSEEEMKIINDRIKIIEKEEIEKLLPKEINCPKCYGPNPFENDECMFCNYKFNKSKYYDLEYYENLEENKKDGEELEKDSYAFQYIISFLIPLVGFILGAILLSKEDDEKVAVGKHCIIIGIVSIVIYVITCILVLMA